MTEKERILANPIVYMIVGDLDKPFHMCECRCYECEEWRKDNGRPTHKECEEVRRLNNAKSD